MMRTDCFLAIFLTLAPVSGIPPAVEIDSGTVEQSEFSAEDAGVKNPVAVPDDVLAILRKDKTVLGILEGQHLQPTNLPPSWFSASAIHLSTSKRADLVVVGEPPVTGGNVTIFWVIRVTADGHELVLTAPAHDLIVRNRRWKGYREIELVSMTAVQISNVLCRFDGSQYAQFQSKSRPIP
jgi:hypothetical protein